MPLGILESLPVILLLAYVPILCWMDWKHRRVEHNVWLPLLGFNVALYFILFVMGTYSWATFVISLPQVVIWFIAMRKDIIPGADFIFLCLISLFGILNPLSGRMLVLPFLVYLFVFMGATVWYGWLVHRKEGNVLLKTLNYPLMIPISLALIMAVIMG